MRINDKSESKMSKNIHGFQMRDTTEEHTNTEFASEFGVAGSEISKVKKMVNRD